MLVKLALIALSFILTFYAAAKFYERALSPKFSALSFTTFFFVLSVVLLFESNLLKLDVFSRYTQMSVFEFSLHLLHVQVGAFLAIVIVPFLLLTIFEYLLLSFFHQNIKLRNQNCLTSIKVALIFFILSVCSIEIYEFIESRLLNV